MRWHPPSKRRPKMSSATPTAPTACPGRPASPRSRTSPSGSATSSPARSSAWPSKTKPAGNPPKPCAPAPPARGPWSRAPSRRGRAAAAAGWSPGTSPPLTAPAAGGLFFPQSKSLGLDRTGYGPALQDKIIYAAVTNPSFDAASEGLTRLAEADVPAKEVERLAKQIGRERCDERDRAAAAYLALPLPRRKEAPPGVEPPSLAVVGTDGGRIQIRDHPAGPEPAEQPTGPAPTPAEPALADEDPGRRGRHWREDKVGLLMAMASEESAADPCPEVPGGFLDPTRMGKLVRQLRKGVPVTQEPAAPSQDPEADQQAVHEGGPTWEPPVVEHRRLVASRRPWEQFGPLVAAAAWAMGLFAAGRRAFVGDGAESNWSIWRDYFSSFVPILDFIHALSYVYAAAHAGRERAAGWRCYARWIGWVWQGRVSAVLDELGQRQAELGEPQESDKEGGPRQVVAQARAYLSNNAGRMRYDEYRRQGLPITSSYVESAVKQFNQRVKGTEKFWSEEGAEAMLQLRADYLSDDQPLAAFWARRQAQQTGQRPYRRSA